MTKTLQLIQSAGHTAHPGPPLLKRLLSQSASFIFST